MFDSESGRIMPSSSEFNVKSTCSCLGRADYSMDLHILNILFFILMSRTAFSADNYSLEFNLIYGYDCSSANYFYFILAFLFSFLFLRSSSYYSRIFFDSKICNSRLDITLLFLAPPTNWLFKSFYCFLSSASFSSCSLRLNNSSLWVCQSNM